MFLNDQAHFFRVFWVCLFFMKESPILISLKQKILDEILTFCWKVIFKIIYTFYLNIKNIPSVHRISTLYLKLSLMNGYKFTNMTGIFYAFTQFVADFVYF